MIFLNDLLGKMWYTTNIILIEREKFDIVRKNADLKEFKNQALFSGPLNRMQGVVNSHLLNRAVESCGVIDDIFIIILRK